MFLWPSWFTFLARARFDVFRRSVTYPFPEIMLHAVCRDTTAYPKPCLYCHMERAGETTEVRFIPTQPAGAAPATAAAAAAGGGDGGGEEASASVLDDIFRVMSECASLHPDPQEAGAGTSYPSLRRLAALCMSIDDVLTRTAFGIGAWP